MLCTYNTPELENLYVTFDLYYFSIIREKAGEMVFPE